MTGKLHWAKETWKNKVLEPHRDLQHDLPTLNSENWFALPATPMIQAPSILHFSTPLIDPPIATAGLNSGRLWIAERWGSTNPRAMAESGRLSEPVMKSWGDHHQGVLGSWSGWTELKWWTKSSARNKLMNLIWIWLVASNFQTWFVFHHIWDNPSHWLIFFRGVETTNEGIKWFGVAQNPSKNCAHIFAGNQGLTFYPDLFHRSFSQGLTCFDLCRSALPISTWQLSSTCWCIFV